MHQVSKSEHQMVLTHSCYIKQNLSKEGGFLDSLYCFREKLVFVLQLFFRWNKLMEPYLLLSWNNVDSFMM